MKRKNVKKKNYIIVIVTAIFLLTSAPMVLAANHFSTTVYLPAILAAGVQKEKRNNAATLVSTSKKLLSTGNFLLDYNQAIQGLTPDRFSLEEVVRRYNEMNYNALVCKQVSYYHLDGGPFDKIILDNKLYDILVIESMPKRWNHGPFSMDYHGQCKNWP